MQLMWLKIIKKMSFVLLGVCVLGGLLKASPNHGQNHARIEMLSPVSALGNKKDITLGMSMAIEKGWHIYWRSPGPFAKPMTFDLTGSENLASFDIYWPKPEHFVFFGIGTLGYENEVIFPFSVQVKDNKKPLKLNVKISQLVCSSSGCFPETQTISLTLQPGPATKTKDAPRVEAAAKGAPALTPSPTISIPDDLLKVRVQKNALLVTVNAHSSKGFKAPVALLEGGGSFYVDQPTLSLSKDKKDLTAVFPVYKTETKKAPADESFYLKTRLRVSVFDGDEGREAYVFTDHSFNIGAYLYVLLAALVGGLILNIMPCVLPVLSLKIFSVLKSTDESLPQIRSEFKITTYGILSTFVLMGVIGALLKELGVAVGWGMQFQQPQFLVGIGLILVFFTANLWDFFDVFAPQGLLRYLTPFLTKEGNAQHFFMGAFLTILATPCTAPFLATALSFSLSRGPAGIIFFFFIIGVGLAIPYIAVACFPSLVYKFPKPGPWMIFLRKVLGFLVFFTFLWILWIMMRQVDPLTSIAASVVLLNFLFLFWVRNKAQPSREKKILDVLILTSAIGVFFLPFEKKVSETNAIGGLWHTFEPLRIPELVNQGQLVFVDVTADWCLTCKANESLVLGRPEVKDLLKKYKVYTMRADWTLPKDDISRYLEHFNEYGIPLYVVYGPKKPKGVKLSQLLTEETLKDAFDGARMDDQSPRAKAP